MVGLIITIFIVYKDTSNSSSFAIWFIIGYIICLVLFCLYSTFMVVLRLRELKWVEIRKRLFKSICYFIAFLVLNLVTDYFSKSTIDVLKNASIALGLSFGISFYNSIFLDEKQDL